MTVAPPSLALPVLPPPVVSGAGTVVAIGNFDGVHRGHRAVIDAAKDVARRLALPLVVLTFEPHPLEFFKADLPAFRLTLQSEKERLLKSAGADHVAALPFDAAMAGLSAAEFIDRILKQYLQAVHVVVGHDFAFGRGRGGTVDTLGAALGVTTVSPVTCADGAVFSSTRIREHLRAGDMQVAATLLGRPWEMTAPVIHGNKRGRTLGYPTANQRVDRYVQIPYGVYAVEVVLDGETAPRPAVANFGIRPMFESPVPLFETFIFDFEGDLYDRPLTVRPHTRLRGEMKFDSLDGLLAQMQDDCARARAILADAAALKTGT